MTTTIQSLSMTRSLSPVQWALRLEGLAVLIAAAVLYGRYGAGWGLFALLLLTPDLAFIVYVVDKEIGRGIYNLVHWYALPLALGMGGLLLDWQLGITLALIWTAHIGLDRVVGYGLKYAGDNKDTHIQRA